MNLEILKRESDQYDRSRCFGRNNDELYVSSSPTNTVISALTDLDTDETSDDSSNSRRVLIPKNSVKVLPTSATLLIGEQCRLMQSKGETVFKFGFGQSPFLPPKRVVDVHNRRGHHKEYVSAQGLLELREAVAAYHNYYDGLDIHPNNVVIGPGSKVLIFSLLACFKAADVLLVTPSWVSYEPQVVLAGLDVTRIQTTLESNWRLTPEMIRRTFRGRRHKNCAACILILNYPGNPNGLTYSSLELKALAQVFREYGVIVVSDEIYGHLHYGNRHTSLARHYPEGTIVTSGLSKWCGAGGWRLGVALLPHSLSAKLLPTFIGVCSETFSCANTPTQYAAIEAYKVGSDVEQYLAHQRRILQLAASHFYTNLSAVGVDVRMPEGGFYCFPDFRVFSRALQIERGVHTSQELCTDIMQRTGVALLPGSSFGTPSHILTFRLAFVDFDGEAAFEASEHVGLDATLPPTFFSEFLPKLEEGCNRLVQYCRELHDLSIEPSDRLSDLSTNTTERLSEASVDPMYQQLMDQCRLSSNSGLNGGVGATGGSGVSGVFTDLSSGLFSIQEHTGIETFVAHDEK